MSTSRNILITGGAGFIGSHLVRHFVKKYPQYQIVNLDALTYAGNLESINDLQSSSNYAFQKGDISNFEVCKDVMRAHEIDAIIHLAAESHVDRSISGPMPFVLTNVVGTVNLLEAARAYWKESKKDNLFYHVSTDEVYGSLGKEGFFDEQSKYDPKSPYSASKASSDHFVRAYNHTYGIPMVISNCSNNYGPYQFPEKLIPLMIRNMMEGKALPVYGDGSNVRDWLYVQDHVDAIDSIFHKGVNGETYLVGGNNEMSNLELIYTLCKVMSEKSDKSVEYYRGLITFVPDRPGHDKRYAINSQKVQESLGWKSTFSFEENLSNTVQWYLDNQDWLNRILNEDYLKYYETQYLKS